MCHYRFEKQFPYVATECLKYSDINALNDKCLVEVEVKISKSDLKAEFKTAGNKHTKHFILYCNPSCRPLAIIPNYYYICVPEELKKDAIDIVKEINPKYGVLVCKCIAGAYKIGVKNSLFFFDLLFFPTKNKYPYIKYLSLVFISD